MAHEASYLAPATTSLRQSPPPDAVEQAGAIASALVNQITELDPHHTVLPGCPTATLPVLASTPP